MVIKNLENKIKLVMIICSLFLVGCIIISISSIWTARVMVTMLSKRFMSSMAMCQSWYSVARWRKPSMWKPRAI